MHDQRNARRRTSRTQAAFAVVALAAVLAAVGAGVTAEHGLRHSEASRSWKHSISGEVAAVASPMSRSWRAS